MRAFSRARPSPSRTPERRRSTSPQTSFRERYAMWKSAEKRHQKTARPQRSWGGSECERSARIPGRVVRAVSHARPSPSRTPERRRSTSPQTSFRERCVVCRSAEKRHQITARPPPGRGDRRQKTASRIHANSGVHTKDCTAHANAHRLIVVIR